MHRLTPHRASRLLAAALVVASATLAPAVRAQQERGAGEKGDTGRTGTSTGDSPLAPSPGLSPEDVVAIQLDALPHNDTPSLDAGIATTFRFASPANRVATGPLDRFADLVKTSAYRAMINHRRVERGPMHVDGDDARQRVVVYSATGARAAYMFILSRQHGGPYNGCWMTDGVTRIDDTGPRVDGLRSA
jgi:hypothetical protein